MSLSDDDELPPLKKGSFAAVLDSDHACRDRLRRGNRGQLLRWVKSEEGQELVGQQSMVAIALNVRPLTLLARFWCPKAEKNLEITWHSNDQGGGRVCQNNSLQAPQKILSGFA